ncbi:hypothetical protein PIB30_011996 [Stylosanthes scabra]|uniref:Disease resistance protein At4g27190-like leucine-rich repeats domain-containing protein n=1 Tax=Stylosanthes scabra TaxID=79078 RepID=A0ABU6Y7S5_9FABA|nr:hypothetical protein [Stylosanthes scabra]
MAFDSQAFQNLKNLSISECDSIKHIFSPANGEVMPQLEKLHIKGCKEMSNLVGCSKDKEAAEDYNYEGKVKSIVFKKLYHLSLSHLPKLESICANSYVQVQCPSLMHLNIDDCPMLKVSSFQIQKHFMQENAHGVTSNSNTRHTNLENSKRNKPSHSNCFLECAPALSRFIHQANTNKMGDKTATIAKDQPSSITMMDSMPILEKIYINGCHDMQNIWHLIGKNYDPTIHSQLKTIQIERCEKLVSIVSKTNGEEIKNMMEYFSELQSLDLKNLSNLSSFCCSEVMGACEGNQIQVVPFIDVDVLLFSNLRSLVIENCNKIHILFSSSSSKSLGCLEELELQYCESIVEIVSANNIVFHCPSMGMFSEGFSNTPKLKDFKMMIGRYHSEYVHKGDLNATIKGFKAFVELQDVEMLSWNDPHNEGLIYFINSEMDLERFHKLRMVVPFNDRRKLQNVRRLCIENCDSLVEVIYCKMMEAIVTEEYDDENREKDVLEGEKKKIKEVYLSMLPKLLSLTLPNVLQRVMNLTISNCDSLQKIFESEEVFDVNQGNVSTQYEIENMELWMLPKLTHIWGAGINRKLVSFDKLTSIRIEKCNSLKSLLSYSMARNLVQLQSVSVVDCGMIEVIVTTEDDESMDKDNIGNKPISLFPNLHKLCLSHLPKLECICSQLDFGYGIPLHSDEGDQEDNKEINDNGQIHISLPQLIEVTLIRVPSLKCFCPGAFDYDLTLSSSSSSFSNGNPKVTVRTPKLRMCYIDRERASFLSLFRFRYSRHEKYKEVPVLGDINLTIHLFCNEEKYKVELQRLDTLACIEQDGYQHLLAYILRSRKLILDSCHKLITCIPSDMKNRLLFHHLEELNVEHCECLQVIFESNDFGGTELSSMRLSSLPKLKHIWRGLPGPLSSFTNLQYLTVKECHDMKFVFPNVSVAMNLSSLSQLIVSECNQMEEIIQKENVDNSFLSKEDKVIFSALKYIDLEKLPELRYFCKSSFRYELSSCTQIDIKECHKMETFCSGTLCAPKLERIHVEGMKWDGNENINEVIKGKHHGIN